MSNWQEKVESLFDELNSKIAVVVATALAGLEIMVVSGNVVSGVGVGVGVGDSETADKGVIAGPPPPERKDKAGVGLGDGNFARLGFISSTIAGGTSTFCGKVSSVMPLFAFS